MDYTLDVEWTGSYPCLCSGEWIIKYNGIKLKVPNEYKTKDMNTSGEYSHWYFDDNMSEYDEYYEDGLDEANWINENYNWIENMFNKENIVITKELLSDLYDKIHAQDFRSGSCGGCI